MAKDFRETRSGKAGVQKAQSIIKDLELMPVTFIGQYLYGLMSVVKPELDKRDLFFDGILCSYGLAVFADTRSTVMEAGILRGRSVVEYKHLWYQNGTAANGYKGFMASLMPTLRKYGLAIMLTTERSA